MPRYIDCPECGRKNVEHEAHGLCARCYRPPKEKCSFCGEIKKVEKRDSNKVICPKCYKANYKRPKDVCSICGKIGRIEVRSDNDVICSKCYSVPHEECIICKKVGPVCKRNKRGPICKRCYNRNYMTPVESCIICNSYQNVYKRTSEGPICKFCYNKQYNSTYTRKERICANCSNKKVIYGNGLCKNCYETKKYHSDEKHRIIVLLRNRLKTAFKQYSENGKIKKSKEYDIDYQKIFEHLGKKPGNNYHIDHIFPLSAFNFDNAMHIRAAFAPENHQWLLAKNNLSKNCSYDIKLFEEYIKKFEDGHVE